MAHIITDEHRAALYQRLLGDLPTDALERLAADAAGEVSISGMAEREAVEQLVRAARDCVDGAGDWPLAALREALAPFAAVVSA